MQFCDAFFIHFQSEDELVVIDKPTGDESSKTSSVVTPQAAVAAPLAAAVAVPIVSVPPVQENPAVASTSIAETKTAPVETILQATADIKEPTKPAAITVAEAKKSIQAILDTIFGLNGKAVEWKTAAEQIASLRASLATLEEKSASENLQHDINTCDALLLLEQGDWRDWYVLVCFLPLETQVWCIRHIKTVYDKLTSLLPGWPVSVQEGSSLPWMAMFPLIAVRHIQFNGKPFSIAEEKIGLSVVADMLRESNDLHAKAFLGWCYNEGLFVTKSSETAVSLWSDAAKQGHVRAAMWLARKLEHEKCLKAQWMPILRQAAEQGHPPAQNLLYVDLEDKAEAAKWLSKSASQGWTVALSNQANSTTDVTERYKKRLAIEKCGCPTNTKCLAEHYENGLGTEKDLKQAYRLYKSVVELLGESTRDPGAKDDLATCHYKLGMWFKEGHADIEVKQNFQQAFYHFGTGAALNNANCQHEVGWAYEHGSGVTKDLKSAFDWYVRSANNNHVWSAFFAGYCLHHERGTTINYAEARKWYQKAIVGGCDPAKFFYGILLEQGKGGEKDPQAAFKLYSEVAASNCQKTVEAKHYVAWCYECGTGVGKDEVILRHLRVDGC